MNRRRRDSDRDEPSVSDVSTLKGQPDVLRSEVSRSLEDWSEAERTDFQALLKRARTELQREFILRAAAARHTLEEIESFADHIREEPDASVFELCTVRPGRAGGSVVKLLRAESDPLYAMALNGETPRARRADAEPDVSYSDLIGAGRARHSPPAALFVHPPTLPMSPNAALFEQESSASRGKALQLRELGNSGEEAKPRPGPRRRSSTRGTPVVSAGGGAPGALDDALSHLGIRFREQPVDGRGLPLEKALAAMARALERGIPIPVALGRKESDHGRQVLVLQVQPAGGARAFQFHDPFEQETVWVHERTLLGRTDLPFEARVWRRVTVVYLPIDGAGGSPSKVGLR